MHTFINLTSLRGSTLWSIIYTSWLVKSTCSKIQLHITRSCMYVTTCSTDGHGSISNYKSSEYNFITTGTNTQICRHSTLLHTYKLQYILRTKHLKWSLFLTDGHIILYWEVFYMAHFIMKWFNCLALLFWIVISFRILQSHTCT